MGKKLYVGNLPYSVRDGDLEQAFGQFGSVTSAKVMMERDTGRSKGFGFVEMGSDEEAQSAISGMNGQPFERPVSRSIMTLALVTEPNWPKACSKSPSRTEYGRLPTYSFLPIERDSSKHKNKSDGAPKTHQQT